MATIVCLLAVLRACFASRRQLVLENAALRQQLLVLRRRTPKRHARTDEKAFWMVLSRLLPTWRQVALIVSPATVLRWHKAGFRALWRWKCRHKLGRPEIPRKLYCLIRKLARENPTWGSPRIAAELELQGWKVSKNTVWRYMGRCHDRYPGQAWKTFIRNHLNVTAACDFFVVPTASFRNLFVFVVLTHDRRLIRHVAVTAHPTAQWTAEQVALAFPDQRPQILLRDNDGIYGDDFSEAVQTMAIEELRTAIRSPWMNPYVERVIGTLRRECTDHVLPLNQQHLERALREYVARYYNPSRPHLSLEGNSPLPRTRDPTPAAAIDGEPVLGGLHHRYRRAG